MASLIGKLGSTITGKVSDFGAGFKAAAMSGNPALFGMAMKGIEKALESNTKEVKKDREERKRKEQYDEENKNEQMKVFSDIQKSLDSIATDVRKILEAMTGKKAEGGGFLEGLKNAVLALLAFFKSIPGKIAEFFGKIGKFFSGIFDALKANIGKILGFLGELADALKAKFAKLLQFFDDLFSKLPSFDDIFRFIRGKFDDAAKFFADIFKALKGKLSNLGKFFSDLFDAFKLKFPGVSGFVASVGAKIAQLFNSVMNVFDDVMKSIRSSKIGQIAEASFGRIKNFFSGILDEFVARLPKISLPEFKLPELPSFSKFIDDIKNAFFNGRLVMNLEDLKLLVSEGGILEKIATVMGTVFETVKSGFSKVISFFEPIGKLFADLTLPTGILAKLGPAIGKVFKALPIIGEIVMVLEGLFVAFDTEQLAEIFYKLPSEVSFKDRLMGFVAGVVGSFFGLVDLLFQAVDWAFGTSLAAKEGEDSIQTKATRIIGRFLMDVGDWIGSVFNLLAGALTLDGPRIKGALATMGEIIGDYMTSISNLTNRMFAAMYDMMLNMVPDWLPGSESIKGWLKGKAEENRANSNQVSGRQQRLESEKASRAAAQPPAPAPKPKNISTSAPAGASYSTGGGGNLSNLSSSQKKMAQTIYDRFVAAGFTPEQAQAAVVNAWYESGLNPNAANVSAREASFGLFQMNTMGGLGSGYTQGQLSDPLFNIDLAIAQAKKTGGFTSAANVQDATSAFTYGVMRPANTAVQAQVRSSGSNAVLSALGITASATTQNAESTDELKRIIIDTSDRQVATVDLIAEKEAQDRQANMDLLRKTEAAIADQTQQQTRHYQYVVRNDAETMRYQQERANLEQRFYNQLEQSFRQVIDKLMGGMMTQTTGAGYKAASKFLQQPLEKLGVKIFGQETGGAMGQIFSQLAGSYADQLVSQVVGPALGMSGVQSQRAFNNLLQGNYKNFYEDMVYGMTGVAIGPRSIMGYEQGALSIAKELAMVTGAPFSPMFNIGNQTPNQVYPGNVYGGVGGSNAYADAIRVTVGDPMVNAINQQSQVLSQGFNNVTQAIVNPRAVLGQPGILPPPISAGGGGTVQIFDQATGQYINVKQSQLPGGSDFVGPPAPGMAGFMERNPNLANQGTRLIGSLASSFLGSKLGVNQGTFGGSLAQAGLDVFIQSALTGQNPLSALTNMGPGKLLGMGITKLGTTFGSQMLTDFGGGLSGSAFGGGSSFSQFGSFMEAGNLAAQAGYVVGVIGSAMTSKAIADAFSGGYKSGIGDGIAIVGSFFDPTGGFISGAAAAVWNRAFGRKAPEVKKAGIRGTLSTDSSATNIYQYQDITEEGGWFRSDKNYTNTQAADKQIIKGIQNAISATKSGIIGNLIQLGYGMDTSKFGTGKTMEFGGNAMLSAALGGALGVVTSVLGGDGSVGLSKLQEYGNTMKIVNSPEFAGAGPSGIFKYGDNYYKKIKSTTSEQDVMTQVYDENSGTYIDVPTGEKKKVTTDAAIQLLGGGANEAYYEAFQKMKTQKFSMPLDLDFLNKSEEQIKEMLEKAIRDFANASIKNAFGTTLDVFKKEGEDLVGAFDRMAKATITLDETLLKLGATFDNLALSATGDIFAIANAKSDILDKFGGADLFGKTTSTFFQKFYTQEEQAKYLKGLSEREMLKSLQAAEFAGAGVGGDKVAFKVGETEVKYGSTYQESIKNYRKFLDDWIVSKGGVRNTETGMIDYTAFLNGATQETADQYMMLIGELSEKFLTGAQAADTLNKSLGSTREALKQAAYLAFKATANASVGFADGGIARGPNTGYAALLHGVEAVVPLPDGREIPVELKLPQSDLGVSKTFVNNIVGNGNAAVKSSPTTVISASPSASSSVPANRVITVAY